MYRRHIRMAQIQAAESESGIKSKFLKQVSNIPAVIFACNVATGTYKNIKAWNKLLNFSLTNAERAAVFITKQVKPIVEKYELHIQAVDDFACKGLKNLEVLVPALIKQPEHLVRSASTAYIEMVESGLHKYEEVKHNSLTTAKDVTELGVKKSMEFLNSPYGQLFLLALESTFDAYEIYLDHYLPPLGDEGPEQLFGDKGKQPVWERADILTNRFKERLIKHSLLRLQNIRVRVKLALAKMHKAKMSDCIGAVVGPSHRQTYEHIMEVLINLQELVKFVLTLLNLRKPNGRNVPERIEV